VSSEKLTSTSTYLFAIRSVLGEDYQLAEPSAACTEHLTNNLIEMKEWTYVTVTRYRISANKLYLQIELSIPTFLAAPVSHMRQR